MGAGPGTTFCVVDIGHDPDDAPGHRLAEVWIGPPHVMVERVALREQALRHALTHDDDELAVALVLGVEVAAGDQRHAERREETRRDVAQPGARLLFAVCGRVALDRERQPCR